MRTGHRIEIWSGAWRQAHIDPPPAPAAADRWHPGVYAGTADGPGRILVRLDASGLPTTIHQAHTREPQ